MTQLTNNMFCIEVPENAWLFKIVGNIFTCNYNKQESAFNFVLPPGNYRILFPTKDMTEEQAAILVEKDGKGYKDYYEDFPLNMIAYEIAVRSFKSLLRSKGLDPANNYLLIEKVEE